MGGATSIHSWRGQGKHCLLFCTWPVSRNSAQKYVNSHMRVSAFHWPLSREVGIWHSIVFFFPEELSLAIWHTHTHTHTELRLWRPWDQFAVALSLKDPGSVSRDAILAPTFLLSYVPTSLLLTHRVRHFGSTRSEKLLTSWATTSFSRRILLHGVSHLYCLRPVVLDEILEWKYRLCYTAVFYHYHVWPL